MGQKGSRAFFREVREAGCTKKTMVELASPPDNDEAERYVEVSATHASFYKDSTSRIRTGRGGGKGGGGATEKGSVPRVTIAAVPFSTRHESHHRDNGKPAPHRETDPAYPLNYPSFLPTSCSKKYYMTSIAEARHHP